MSLNGLFMVRACGLLLILGGISVGFFYRTWGIGVVPCLGWAAAWAWVLGAVGFRSMQKGLLLKANESTQVTGILLLGVLFRLLILGGSQGAVYVIAGNDWGNRALLATASYYVLVLGVEVYTLAQEMGIVGGSRRQRASRRSEGNSG